jgi:hypothetical protein
MRAAGVGRLSDLQTLRVTTRTVMSQGTVMVAARTPARPSINWSAVATESRTAASADRQILLASVLANQNSQPVLARALALAPAAPAGSAPSPVPPAHTGVSLAAGATGVLPRTAETVQPLAHLVKLRTRPRSATSTASRSE